ncbi:MAG: exo-beta-N-acetylmuramidase NamZ domain-containing protein [Limnochordia bacterium]|jgi:uncharacterized protein YbbC (DUF1343 family)
MATKSGSRKQRVRLGVDRLLDSEYKKLEGKRLGLMTNETGQTADMVSTIDALLEHPALDLVALFGPEHGVRGYAQGTRVPSRADPTTGLPMYSLWRQGSLKPDPEMLDAIDAIVFDIQDAGVRFFTYMSSLAYVMQAVVDRDIEIVVLDRPNPVTGTRVEGTVLDPEFSSFVGLYPIALRHGMTAGELATMFNQEFGIGCKLSVITMEGWKRSWWYDETGLIWVPPGPNVSTIDSTTVYPGTCLIEGVNVSEGRGTTRAFELIGAPWIDARELWRRMRTLDLPGVLFRQAYFIPTFHKYQGELCAGVQFHITDRHAFDPIRATLHLISVIRKLHPEHLEFRSYFDRLMGTDTVRKQLESGEDVDSIVDGWTPDLESFLRRREKYLIYD